MNFIAEFHTKESIAVSVKGYDLLRLLGADITWNLRQGCNLNIDDKEMDDGDFEVGVSLFWSLPVRK